jgi:ABC-type nitrate/sulfonate/bicarbonate transport system permease component
VKNPIAISMTQVIVSSSLIALIALLALFWEFAPSNPKESVIVIYFDRPSDVLSFMQSNGYDLAKSALGTATTALVSLLLAAVLSCAMILIGARSENSIRIIERLAAATQAIPFIAVVAVLFIFQKAMFSYLSIRPTVTLYCLAPVTLSLLFPPLAAGSSALLRVPYEAKVLMCLWATPTWDRIWRVYFPLTIPSLLTGLRTSATWTIAATLIAEGMLNGVEGDTGTLGHYLIRPFGRSGAEGRFVALVLVSTILGFSVYWGFVFLQQYIERYLLGGAAQKEQSFPLQAK